MKTKYSTKATILACSLAALASSCAGLFGPFDNPADPARYGARVIRSSYAAGSSYLGNVNGDSFLSVVEGRGLQFYENIDADPLRLYSLGDGSWLEGDPTTPPAAGRGIRGNDGDYYEFVLSGGFISILATSPDGSTRSRETNLVTSQLSTGASSPMYTFAAAAADGTVYAAGLGEAGGRVIYRILPDGSHSIHAGSGEPHTGAADFAEVPATQHRITHLESIAVSPEGLLYFVEDGDSGNDCVVWRVASSGVVERVAGGGRRERIVDIQGYPGREAAIPILESDLAFDADGNLIFMFRMRLWMVDHVTGFMGSVAGGYSLKPYQDSIDFQKGALHWPNALELVLGGIGCRLYVDRSDGTIYILQRFNRDSRILALHRGSGPTHVP